MTILKKIDRMLKTEFKEPQQPKRNKPTKCVYICSSRNRNVEENIIRAEDYCRFAYEKGFRPICPYIYYTRFLNYKNRDERLMAVRYGLEDMWQCKEVWVFTTLISDEMVQEVALAKELEIPVRFFDHNLEEIM